jgi:transposase
MDRQTLRDWVIHYNEEGIEGLSNRRSPGRPAQLTAEQLAAFKALVEQGPDLARDGVVRWRCSDLQARLQSDFAVQYHERSVGKLLAKLAFRKLTARPFHPEQDIAAQETHKKTLPA